MVQDGKQIVDVTVRRALPGCDETSESWKGKPIGLRASLSTWVKNTVRSMEYPHLWDEIVPFFLGRGVGYYG